MYVPDNYDLWKAHDAEQQRKLERLPKCDYCDNPIIEEFYYDLDGDIVCEDCLDRFFKKAVDDYVG